MTTETLLRSRPQSSKLYLSIYKPNTILACQFNSATGTVGAQTLPYDNVSTGSYSNVVAGMTLLVGSQPGKADYGRVRIKSATASTITVAENSHINWQNNLYLTAINFFEPWAVLPYYVINGDTEVPYKDYNIAYSDQNSVLGTIICMGPNYAGWAGDQVWFSSSGTVNVKGEAMTFAWSFPGGSPSSSASANPGYVTYNTPGHYIASCRVTTVEGADDTAYRHISIYNKPGDGTNLPVLKWEMDDLSGSRDEGGYTTTIKIRQKIDYLMDGSLVVIFSDDWYGTDHQSIGGNAENRSSILFVGYIQEGSIHYDYANSYVEFKVSSITESMKNLPGPSVSVDSVVTPTSWYELPDMDVEMLLYHYFRWQSTILKVADLRYIGTNYKFQYFDSDPSTLYDAINTFMRTSLMGELVSDTQGTMWAEVGARVIDNATGTLPVNTELYKQDWANEPSIQERTTPALSYAEFGGVSWDSASTGTSTALLASAPGTAPGYWGKTEDISGLILSSQIQLNQLAGNYFAWQNARYSSIELDLTGAYRTLGIAPQKQVLMTIYPGDTQRGITFLHKPFIIEEESYSYDSELETLFKTITLHEITQGYAGATVDIPQPGIINIPPVPNPTPIIPIIPAPIIPPGGIIPPPPPVIPPDPITDITCKTDLSAPENGPYALHMGGTVTSGDTYTRFGPIKAALRSPLATNKSKYVISGSFLSRNATSIPIGTWAATTDDDFYHIYAIGINGARIAEGIHDPVTGSGEVRTGTFNNVAATDIYGIELYMDYVDIPSGTIDVTFSAITVGVGYVTYEYHTWYWEGPTLVVISEYHQEKNTGSPDYFGGERKMYVLVDGDDQPFFQRWLHRQVSVADLLINCHLYGGGDQIGFTSSYTDIDNDTPIDDYSPPSGAADPWFSHKIQIVGDSIPQTAVIYSKHKWTPLPSKRIDVTDIYLYNICGQS